MMPINEGEIKGIKDKLGELNDKVSALTALFFSYHIATMKYLKDKRIADPKEFEGYLAEAKKEFKLLDDDVEFLKIMRDLKGEKGK